MKLCTDRMAMQLAWTWAMFVAISVFKRAVMPWEMFGVVWF